MLAGCMAPPTLAHPPTGAAWLCDTHLTSASKCTSHNELEDCHDARCVPTPANGEGLSGASLQAGSRPKGKGRLAPPHASSRVESGRAPVCPDASTQCTDAGRTPAWLCRAREGRLTRDAKAACLRGCVGCWWRRCPVMHARHGMCSAPGCTHGPRCRRDGPPGETRVPASVEACVHLGAARVFALLGRLRCALAWRPPPRPGATAWVAWAPGLLVAPLHVLRRRGAALCGASPRVAPRRRGQWARRQDHVWTGVAGLAFAALGAVRLSRGASCATHLLYAGCFLCTPPVGGPRPGHASCARGPDSWAHLLHSGT